MTDAFDPADPLDVAIRQVTAEVVAAERARIHTEVETQIDKIKAWCDARGHWSGVLRGQMEALEHMKAWLESGEQP